MLEEEDSGFYYITLYNENYTHPAITSGVEEGILRGMYRLESTSEDTDMLRVQLMGSGSMLQQVIAAAKLLHDEFNIASDIWSVTSFSELRKDGVECDRWNMLHPHEEAKVPYVTQQLSGTRGPVIVATDYLRAYPDLIRNWVHRHYSVLGTDGFGRSDTRSQLRDYFEVDHRYICLAALTSLQREGLIDKDVLLDGMKFLQIDSEKMNPLNG